jgi:cytochrome P450
MSDIPPDSEGEAGADVLDQSKCPHFEGVAFDPMVPPQVMQPYPWLAVARREQPVFYMPQYNEWFVTRYEDILEIIRDTSRFSNAHTVELQDLPRMDRELPDGNPLAKGLVNTDPPEHTPMRKIAQKAFTPRAITGYEPWTRELADAMIDTFADNGRADLIQEYTRELTAQVITRIIGAPLEKARDFQTNADLLLGSLTISPPLTDEREREIVENMLEFDVWVKGFIAERRREPLEDLTSHLVTAVKPDGSPVLDDAQIVRLMMNVITAALDTTSTLIGLTVNSLLVDRSRWERLLEDRSLIPAAIEETLRFEGPVHSIKRDVLEDVEIGGRKIPKGSKIATSFASAMRDEQVFENPDLFDLDRADVDRHFAFGKWTHFCLGAPLARMEVKIAVEALLDRLPRLRYAPDGPGIVVAPTRLGKFFINMNVEW